MTNNLFVYGTLLFPEIVYALTGKQFRTQSGILNDYSQFKLVDNDVPRPYPAISSSIGGKVIGEILFDIDEQSLAILDYYEDIDYEKKIVTVQDENNLTHTVLVYVWIGGDEFKSNLVWNKEEFRQKYLHFYIYNKLPKILINYAKKSKF